MQVGLHELLMQRERVRRLLNKMSGSMVFASLALFDMALPHFVPEISANAAGAREIAGSLLLTL